MFPRLLWKSFVRQRRRKALAALAIFLGTTAITAMLALATTIGDRIYAELAVYGANIVVRPKAETLAVNVGGLNLQPATGNALLRESDLNKLKTIFWANNITGISPELPIQLNFLDAAGAEHTVRATGLWFHHPFGVGSATTGAPQMHPAWRLTGAWPAATDEIVLGTHLATSLNKKIGDVLFLPRSDVPVDSHARVAQGQPFKISGIADTASPFDDQALLPLATVQSLANLPGSVSRVDISARTKPEDAFARKDPDTLSPKQRETWYCRPYANSIAYQIREAIPGSVAEPVRQVEQSEGVVLQRISGLMWLISAAALLAASFAVSAAMATAVLERRAEIGLMRSLGASQAAVATLFYTETALLAALASVAGFLTGSLLADRLGAHIFNGVQIGPLLNPTLLPLVFALALLVAAAGATPSIRTALRTDPSRVLRADA